MEFKAKQVPYAAPGKYKFEVTHGKESYVCYLCPGASLNNLVVDQEGNNITETEIGCLVEIACHHELRR